LVGQHTVVNCKGCHLTLTFKDGRRNCIDCHTDAHNQTLGKDCEKCHTPKTWIISDVTAMHQKTRFPLLGAHKTVDCAKCHKSASNFQFEPLGIECVSCHLSDFQKTTSPNHVTNKYSTDCLECHNQNSNSWNTGLINHDFFPLTGGHNVGCGQCHTTTHYTKISTECNSCHNKHFTAAQTPKHVEAGIPVKCETCHNINAWKPSTFNHLSTGFELKGGHKNVIQCADCHKGNLTSAKQECLSCHQVQYDIAPNHKKVNYPVDCMKCHTQNNWVENIFNHSTTNYPLTGAHTKANCADCHLTTLAGTTTVCSNCHLAAYTSSQVPAHVTAGIPKDCSTCHIPVAWKPSTFNHTTTGYELKGAHKTLVQCSLCHKGNVTTAPQTCVGCHQPKYDTAPNHKSQGYPLDCLTCHTQNNWLENGFNHAATSFPLTGAHTTVLCAKCHTVGFKGTPTVCSSCHLPAYTASQLPGHVAAGIPKECAQCHTPASWKPSAFNHTTTGYELKGAHKLIVQCSSCHKGNVTTAPQVCIGCHQAQYDVAPGHKQSGFSTDCAKCHSQENWLSSSFDHSTTNFPLTGSHTKVLCSICHVNGYVGTPTACSSCHLPAYTSSQLPGHVAAGIPQLCAQCHTPASWKPSMFNHTTTGYELKGAHKNIVQCSDCHKGNLTSASLTCIGCHQANYNAAPNHKAQGYPTDCTICHTQNNWLENNFNHATTAFPLIGSHTTVLCSKCHTVGFKGTSNVCSNCHLPVYTSSQLPGHVAAGIPKECAQCHTPVSWKPSQFNHTTTGYELKGAHKNIVQCSDCHKGNVTTAPQTCVGCHQSNYDTALNHKAQGYPTDCTICHTQNNWLENIFNHATTAFPLTGAHTTVVCAKCHTTGFKGTSTLCFTCHAAKYNATTNPNHLGAKFPTNCEICHSTTAWTPSTYNHDAQYFPINSGKHNGKWTLCSDCHNVATNYAAFTCIVCHEHSNKTSVDNDHKGVKNYAYTPTSCYTCHPRGNN
jgi:predicted CXXCH cytochrome family protein